MRLLVVGHGRMGQLVETESGLELSGRWNYATGSHHAQFTMVPALSPEQQPVLLVLPMSAVQLDFTWQVAAMRGTGSDTVVAAQTPVNPDLVCSFADISATPPPHFDASQLEASDYWVNYPLLRAKSLGVLVGCAEGLLETIATKSGSIARCSCTTLIATSFAKPAAPARRPT